jgi:protein phosphatase
LRKHRDGTWDWVFPVKHKNFNPLPRYQHIICFSGANMFVIGGRTNMPEEATSLIEVYNTETSEWSQFDGISRYRHAVVAVDQTMYVHGGFEPEFASHPLETMVSLDLSMVTPQKHIVENE